MLYKIVNNDIVAMEMLNIIKVPNKDLHWSFNTFIMHHIFHGKYYSHKYRNSDNCSYGHIININHCISSRKFPEKTKFEVIEGHDPTDETKSC